MYLPRQETQDYLRNRAAERVPATSQNCVSIVQPLLHDSVPLVLATLPSLHWQSRPVEIGTPIWVPPDLEICTHYTINRLQFISDLPWWLHATLDDGLTRLTNDSQPKGHATSFLSLPHSILVNVSITRLRCRAVLTYDLGTPPHRSDWSWEREVNVLPMSN
ncbi:uncharacterized protein PG986_009107 [Apiospora aurea]|uniref:Uncharacterized protein n=1 Tax=Apiospora aurea TaxID=335848 RepID=A0ABR1Q800_9PEZI